jgi:pyruvate/2-oxoglutarate dehydrogenase complex dihydrolipoamide acyltransferase (E2) component
MDQIEPSPMSRSRASVEGAAEAHFKWDGDFWQCVVRAVARAAAQYPDFLETTYRDARNNLAYCMK